jgi:hypothetical protein
VPWWAIVLIVIGACAVTGFLVFAGTLLYIGKGMRQLP